LPDDGVEGGLESGGGTIGRIIGWGNHVGEVFVMLWTIVRSVLMPVSFPGFTLLDLVKYCYRFGVRCTCCFHEKELLPMLMSRLRRHT
jgi:hypothetical protein